MTESAHVTSIAAIREFKANVTTFREELSMVLDQIRHKILHAIEYIERDRPVYWKNQVRRGFDDVAEARSRLAACELRRSGDFRPSCIEEKEALALARRRLRQAQETVEHVRRWGLKLRSEWDEFQGRTAQLDNCIQESAPQALRYLERVASILESYADLKSQPEQSQAPSTPDETSS